MVEIKTLGALAIVKDGHSLDLPSSRKTRALLGYLAIEGSEQSRQSLCELLWEIPDDPRASLRWSLSKLRALLTDEGGSPLTADRNIVHLDISRITTDWDRVAKAAQYSAASADELRASWIAAQDILLEDCELPNQRDYSTWLEQRRNELTRTRALLAKRLAQDESLDNAARDRWAQRWLEDAEFAPEAALAAVLARRATGQAEAANQLQNDLRDRFHAAGLQQPDFAGDPGKPGYTRVSDGIASVQNDAAFPDQDIRLLTTQDDVTIAWASVGDKDSPPLVKAANWLTHMELDWQAPIWSPLYRELARSFHFIRYDERGCGLSDWDVSDISVESFVTDLKQVVDAAGIDRFPLLGISQGAAVSIEFAARYPDRVSHLVLFGGYDCGWRHSATDDEIREREAVMVLTESGWGRDNPAYRHMFSQTFMPDATAEELEWFDEFQRQTASAENAVRFLEAFASIDVRDRLEQIECPTLVIHSRGDQRIPFETGRKLAARIPNARFAGIESNNHLLLGRESASTKFVSLVRDFLLE